jgi:DNA-binding CsgD family transcriptional regulator
MKQNPKHSNAIAYLRQLCCSGLDKHIVITEFLRAVQTVIPSGSNTFSVTDEQLNATYHLTEFVVDELDEQTPEIIASFHTPERLSLSAAWFREHPVIPGWEVLDATFYMSDLYNLVFRRFDQHHALFAPVLIDGKPAGMLGLYRPRQQKPFDSREQVLCTQLLPYVSHALSANNNSDIQYSENGTSGMMVMDTQGTILYLTNEAKSLLALACHPVLSLDARNQEVELLAKLAQLCQNLQAIFKGKHAEPPSWSYTNARGRFNFRACWLNKLNNEQDKLISISIEHQEPLVLKLLRSLQALPLSPTQKQVAMLLAQGKSNENIGKTLNIRLPTVKEHIGKIFDKLGVYRREEVLPKLLALESSLLIRKVW